MATSTAPGTRSKTIIVALSIGLLVSALSPARVAAGADSRSVSGNDPGVRADMDRLLEFAMDFCKHVIGTKNFVPFGITLGNDGKTRYFAFAPNGLDGPTDTVSMVAFGRQALRAETKFGRVRAVALVYDGRIRSTDGRLLHPDAVIVEIDHRRAPGAVWYGIPYRLTHGSAGKTEARYVDDVSVNFIDRFAFPDRPPAGSNPAP